MAKRTPKPGRPVHAQARRPRKARPAGERQGAAARRAAPAPGALSRLESVELLRKFRPDVALRNPSLLAIAAELGDLPLALHLAGSYLKRYKADLTPAGYLAELRRPGLLKHPALAGGALAFSPASPEDYAARAFALSYTRLQGDAAADALARQVLTLAALFAPGYPIPEALLNQTLLALAAPEGAAEAGPAPAAPQGRAFADAVLRLAELGLADCEIEGTVRLHRLLAQFVQRVTPRARWGACAAAVEAALCDEAGRLNETGLPAPLRPWAGHLRYVAEQAALRQSGTAGRLFSELGSHLNLDGNYAGARAAFELALKIDEAALGPEHPDVAGDINNLGGVLKALGDLAGARAAFERARRICEQTLSPKDTDLATVANNLGEVLENIGDLAGARRAFERALEVDAAAFGLDHPDVANDVSNLGGVLRALGDHATAHAAFERALQIDEAALGPDHPVVARDLGNLGSVLRDLGDLAGARRAFERALRICERALSAGHPAVATMVGHLGRELQALGDHDWACAVFKRALTIDEAALRPDHPAVARDVSNLGSVLQNLGNHTTARAAFERALKIDEAVFGPDHPNVARDVNNLGAALQDLGDQAGARAAYERALRICERALGPDHPNTQTARENLAAVLRGEDAAHVKETTTQEPPHAG